MTKISKSFGRVAVLATIAVLALSSAFFAKAQEEKPQKSMGISIEDSSVLPLGVQLPELDGYALRIRLIVLQPGANSAYHSHANRPVVAYLVSGEYTEHRDGQSEIAHKPGEQWVEGADVAHWSENPGSETAYLINVEVVPMH